MSDQENITTEGKDEDLEAHGRKRTVLANEGEPQEDSKDEDDVEAHGRKRNLL